MREEGSVASTGMEAIKQALEKSISSCSFPSDMWIEKMKSVANKMCQNFQKCPAVEDIANETKMVKDAVSVAYSEENCCIEDCVDACDEGVSKKVFCSLSNSDSKVCYDGPDSQHMTNKNVLTETEIVFHQDFVPLQLHSSTSNRVLVFHEMKKSKESNKTKVHVESWSSSSDEEIEENITLENMLPSEILDNKSEFGWTQPMRRSSRSTRFQKSFQEENSEDDSIKWDLEDMVM